jgi:hypothetical protein
MLTPSVVVRRWRCRPCAQGVIDHQRGGGLAVGAGDRDQSGCGASLSPNMASTMAAPASRGVPRTRDIHACGCRARH